MSDSRNAARCYFNLNSQKTSPFKRRGFFMAVARPTKNEELRTKNSRNAAIIHHSDRLPQSAGRAAGITQKGDRQYLKKLISFLSN